MISSIEYTNFRSWEHTILQLSDGLNIISGRTHSGKSNLIRGARWALDGKPRGDGFRRDGISNDESVSVTVSFSEKTFISKEKNPNKSINCYHISGQKEPLKAIRSGVPDEVKSITKMGAENIQSQGDRYFFLNKTPGQVASEINKVIGLKIIDDKASKIKKIVSKFSNEFSVLDAQVEKTKHDLSAEKFIIAAELYDEISNIGTAISNYDSVKTKSQKVKSLVDKISYEKEKELKAKRISAIGRDISSVNNKIKKYKRLNSFTNKIFNIVSQIRACEKDLAYSDEIVGLSDDLGTIKSKVSGYEELAAKIASIKEIINLVSENRDISAKAAYTMSKSVEEIDELKSLLETCPKCGAYKSNWRK